MVDLSGDVEWWYQKDAAEEAVRKLVGVVMVSNHISVKPTDKPRDLKGKIENAFHRNALLDARRITIETHEGSVILGGSVRSWAERAEARWSAGAAPGVTEVVDNVTVSP